MQNKLLHYLSLTLNSNTNIVNQASNALQSIFETPNCLITLMHIIDNKQIQYNIRLAAIIQLKNIIKNRWKPKKQQQHLSLIQEQKQRIRGSIITAIIRCQNDYRFIKIYREIITIIVGCDYKKWIGSQEIVHRLSAQQDLPQLMYCLLGICTNFQFTITDLQKRIYTQFLSKTLPLVYQCIQNNPNNIQLIYLGIKFLWKAIHFEIPLECKQYTNQWMDLLLFVISGNNAQYDNNGQVIQKYTPVFYYFHSKKWATRIILRFVQKIVKQRVFGNPISHQNTEFCENWYQNYGTGFISAICQQIQKPTIKKIRYFQLKTLQGITLEKPQLMVNYSDEFMFNILIQYLIITPQLQNLVKNDPIEYFRSQEQQSYTYTNTKKAATDLWITYLQLGSKIDKTKNIKTPGPNFQKAITYLLQKLNDSDLLMKQMSMYLLFKLKSIICMYPQLQLNLNKILKEYIAIELQSNHIILRIRACQLFSAYTKYVIDDTQIAEGILKCLFMPQQILQIKAAIALRNFYNSSSVQKMISSHLKQILITYLRLIQAYDIEQLSQSLSEIVQNFSTAMSPYVFDLFQYLSRLFRQSYSTGEQRDEMSNQYGCQKQLSAYSLINTMNRLLLIPISSEQRHNKLQAQFLKLCYCVFQNNSLDFIEQIMEVIENYIASAEFISDDIWFLFQTIIFYLIGVPPNIYNQLINSNLPQYKKSLLQKLSITRLANLQFIDNALPIISLYITKTTSQTSALQNYHNLLTDRLFMLIHETFYRFSKPNQYESLSPLYSSQMILIYMLQSFPKQLILGSNIFLNTVIDCVKFSVKIKSKNLRLINLQMVFVCLWKIPHQFIYAFTSNNMSIQNIIKQTAECFHNIDSYTKQKRIALGKYLISLGIISLMNVMVFYKQNADINVSELKRLHEILVRLLSKLSKNKQVSHLHQIQESIGYMYPITISNNTDYDSQEEYSDQYGSEDQQFWELTSKNRYQSPLSDVNQLYQYKNIIGIIQHREPTIYAQLMNINSQ